MGPVSLSLANPRQVRLHRDAYYRRAPVLSSVSDSVESHDMSGLDGVGTCSTYRNARPSRSSGVTTLQDSSLLATGWAMPHLAEGGTPLPYLAYSIWRISRMTMTLIWPGYTSVSSILFTMSLARVAAAMSSTDSGFTMMRISLPACMA